MLGPWEGTEIPLYGFAMKPFPKIEDENELRAPTNSASKLAGANYLNYHLAGRARNKPCEFLGFQTVGFRLFMSHCLRIPIICLRLILVFRTKLNLINDLLSQPNQLLIPLYHLQFPYPNNPTPHDRT